MVRALVKGCVGAIAIGLGIWSGATAATMNYSPCLDVEGQGFAGMACSVGPDDFGLSGSDAVNDTQNAVETVLSSLFGESVNIGDYVGGVVGDQTGFDFNTDSVTDEDTVSVLLDQPWTFATVKADTYWTIFDIRGQSDVTLTTDGFIENKVGKAKTIGHIGFWNVASYAPDSVALNNAGPTSNPIPAPATLMVMGFGLAVAGLARRRRA